MSKVGEHIIPTQLNPEISDLVGSYILQILTPSEHKRLHKMLEESDSDMAFFEIATNTKVLMDGLQLLDKFLDTENQLKKIKKKLVFTDNKEDEQKIVVEYEEPRNLVIQKTGVVKEGKHCL